MEFRHRHPEAEYPQHEECQDDVDDPESPRPAHLGGSADLEIGSQRGRRAPSHLQLLGGGLAGAHPVDRPDQRRGGDEHDDERLITRMRSRRCRCAPASPDHRRVQSLQRGDPQRPLPCRMRPTDQSERNRIKADRFRRISGVARVSTPRMRSAPAKSARAPRQPSRYESQVTLMPA